MTDVGRQKGVPEVTLTLLGSRAVGKSSLLRRLTRGSYSNEYVSTVGVDYDSCILEVGGEPMRVHIWDVSGDAVFERLARKYVTLADGVVFVYDVTQADSLRALTTWLALTQECARSASLPKMAVGTKIDDRHRQVIGSCLGKRFAIPEGMAHIEASARDGTNVSLAFHRIASEIVRFWRLGGVRMLAAPPPGGATCRPLYEPPTDGSYDDVTSQPRYTHLFRLMLLGSVRVGKTALHERFCHGRYSPQYYATAGIRYGGRSVFIDGDRVKLQLWDASGDDVYESLRHHSFGAADGFVIVYDVTAPETFRRAQRIVKELALRGQSDAPKVVVGNKRDLFERRLVDEKVAGAWADGWRVPLIEASARSGENVEAPFVKLAVCLKRQHAPWKRVYDFT